MLQGKVSIWKDILGDRWRVIVFRWTRPMLCLPIMLENNKLLQRWQWINRRISNGDERDSCWLCFCIPKSFFFFHTIPSFFIVFHSSSFRVLIHGEQSHCKIQIEFLGTGFLQEVIGYREKLEFHSYYGDRVQCFPSPMNSRRDPVASNPIISNEFLSALIGHVRPGQSSSKEKPFFVQFRFNKYFKSSLTIRNSLCSRDKCNVFDEFLPVYMTERMLLKWFRSSAGRLEIRLVLSQLVFEFRHLVPGSDSVSSVSRRTLDSCCYRVYNEDAIRLHSVTSPPFLRQLDQKWMYIYMLAVIPV